ncbi:hypothetical protein BT96DRAFT_989650 [Gymnopus androsaceus JB14]|uniref:DUF659 domain-containing protein n=1 Tax=Gymnopus androsaceus JB14 TaxID=1447944 RepID=A0A6A4I2I8_9AGAR|nr:hypothetical protein BT96DRAFT_989650 [Gymnopus androsaceus JB14]
MTSGEPKYAEFACTSCRKTIKQGLTGSDAASTGVLIRHARDCFGSKAVKSVRQSKDINKAHEVLKKFGKKSQSKLTAALKTIKGWAESFSTQPPSKESIRVVTACWVSESVRPFHIVKDHGYRWLQKEGHPERYIPSRETVSKDVKNLYEKVKEKLAKEFQEYDGELAIALDCWTSPNHKA